MKGSILMVTRTIEVVIACILVLTLAINTGDSVSGKIRVETIDIAEDRIRSAIYATAALEEGSTQINFKDEYSIVEEDGDYYLEYILGSFSLSILKHRGREVITSPVDFNAETGTDTSFCIIKEKDATEMQIEPGECSI